MKTFICPECSGNMVLSINNEYECENCGETFIFDESTGEWSFKYWGDEGSYYMINEKNRIEGVDPEKMGIVKINHHFP